MLSWPVVAEPESQLKAAFIYNFTKYVLWPAELEQQGGDLRLCVIGNPPSEALKGLQGRPVRAFKLQVVHIKLEKQLADCHVAYLQTDLDNTLAKKVLTLPVLTVSDQPKFVDEGGIIELFQDKRRLRFNVNLKQSKAANVQISAKLLQLAGRVVK